MLDQNEDIDERCDKVNDNASHIYGSSHSTPSPIISVVNNAHYWEDIAQITYDLSSDVSEKFSNRKRSNSSAPSILSSPSSLSSSRSDDGHHHRKRNKQPSPVYSQTADIDVITLSSSDTSDNDD